MRVGVVFQEPSLDDRLTVYENLNFHGLVYGVPGRLRRQRIEEMLELVELTEWRDKLVRTLSSGMKRRVEIARALIHDSRSCSSTSRRSGSTRSRASGSGSTCDACAASGS